MISYTRLNPTRYSSTKIELSSDNKEELENYLRYLNQVYHPYAYDTWFSEVKEIKTSEGFLKYRCVFERANSCD